MDLNKLSINELKVMFYDEQLKAQTANQNMQIINQAIANKAEENPIEGEVVKK